MLMKCGNELVPNQYLEDALHAHIDVLTALQGNYIYSFQWMRPVVLYIQISLLQSATTQQQSSALLHVSAF
jgi:hypothetical protein